MLNSLFTVLVFLALFIVMYLTWKQFKRRDRTEKTKNLTFEYLLEDTKIKLSELIKDDVVVVSDTEYAAYYKKRAKIKNALVDCMYGKETAKLMVIDMIRKIVSEEVDSIETACKVIQFNSSYLDPRIKFEILMYRYKKVHGKKALSYMIEKYNLGQLKHVIEDKTKPSYAIESHEIEAIYATEFADESSKLELHEMIDIISILIFQEYKGFSIVDTINEMNVNGYMFGTSGSNMPEINNNPDAQKFTSKRSVWLYYKGKYIHLRFLEFDSLEQMKRTVQMISMYDNPGALTEKRGYIINRMYDKSRVLALRPPIAENWAVFVRKFNLESVNLEKLFGESGVKNYDLPIGFLKAFMASLESIAFTGRQGSGKTTSMTGAIEYLPPPYNIRTIESSFELFLKELYPERNILALQETPYHSMTEAQNALKKSDSAITFVGEVASSEIWLNMVNSALTASLASHFSHHATSCENLVYDCRNGLVAAGSYDPGSAMDLALQALTWNLHQDYDKSGLRYVERLTEIIPTAQIIEYPVLQDKEGDLAMTLREMATRLTDRPRFTTRDILRYDKKTNSYIPCSLPSAKRLKRVLDNLEGNDKKEFVELIRKYWGDVL